MSDKTKHTPGPWHAGRIRINGADPKMDGCDIGAENGSNIAIVLHQQLDREQAETVANAALVAAAPDLLDALRAAESALVAMLTTDLYVDASKVSAKARAEAIVAASKARAAMFKTQS